MSVERYSVIICKSAFICDYYLPPIRCLPITQWNLNVDVQFRKLVEPTAIQRGNSDGQRVCTLNTLKYEAQRREPYIKQQDKAKSSIN